MLTKITRFCTAIILLLVLEFTVVASPITVPTSLSPGDSYRLAFVTSTTRDATSSDIGVYNTFVTGVANTVPELVALGTTWKPIGSIATVDARDNTGTNPGVSTGVPIFLLNDTKIADDNAELWVGGIAPLLALPKPLLEVFFIIGWAGTVHSGFAGRFIG